jgi:hypothetical protein
LASFHESETGEESTITMFVLVPQTALAVLSVDDPSSQFPGETEFILIGRAV